MIYTPIALIAIVLLLYLLLWLPPVQQKIKDIAVKELKRMTNSEISIGRMNLRPFNNLALDEVYLQDQNGDTLLYTSYLSAGFSLPQLLKNRLLITSVDMDNFVANIYQDSTGGNFNFQYLIDAFASQDTVKDESGSMIIEIEKVKLSGGTIRYNILSEARANEGFDPSHIRLFNLEAELSLNSIDIKKLNTELKSFSFNEGSGFRVKNLAAKITSKDERIHVDKLSLELPDSELKLDKGYIDYSGMELSQIAEGGEYSLVLQIPRLNPADVWMFYLPLRNISEIFTFDTEVTGKFPEINVKHIKGNMGKLLDMDLNARIENYKAWETSPFELNIKNLELDNEAIALLMQLSGTPNPEPFSPGIDYDRAQLKGYAKGSLPDMNLNLDLETNTGDLNVKGKAGYLFNSKAGSFDVRIDSENVNLRTLLHNPDLGIVNLNGDAKGTITENRINGNAQLQIHRFDFNRYAYNRINLNVIFNRNIANVNLVSRDPNLPLTLEALVNLNKNNESAVIKADLNHVLLDTLNLIQDFGRADLTMKLTANIKGFNPERMNASATIDSLLFITNSGIIKQNPFSVSYVAEANNSKNISIAADFIKGTITGNFKLATAAQVFTNRLYTYFPAYFPYKGIKTDNNTNLTGNFTIQNIDGITEALHIPFSIQQPSIINLEFSEPREYIGLYADIPEATVNNLTFNGTKVDLHTDSVQHKIQLIASSMPVIEGTDSIQINLNALGLNDSISFRTDFTSKSSGVTFEGALAANIMFRTLQESKIPEISIDLLPTSVVINENTLKIEPSHIDIQQDKYTIDNFRIGISDTEYLLIDGVISDARSDTLTIVPSHIKIETLLQALKSNMDIRGEINGNIIALQVLSSPLIFTRDLKVTDISFEQNRVGDLTVSSVWREAVQGMAVRATLQQSNNVSSEISGFVLPARDSLSMKAEINDLLLSWLSPFTNDFLFGLSGSLGANIQANGRISSPALSGGVYLQDANIGVKMTNVQYKVNDSISISNDRISFGTFRIVDPNNKVATITGDISHNNFKNISPQIRMTMADFLLVNNPAATDSLFYGTLRMNGTVDLSSSGNDMLANMVLSNSGKGKLMINLPNSDTEVQEFSIVTFINPEDSLLTLSEIEEKRRLEENYQSRGKSFSLPLRLNVALTVTPDLTLGTLLIPGSSDETTVNGNGDINFTYNMSTDDMSLAGQYEITEGKSVLSLQNITKRTFTVEPGGVVRFNGDPDNISFDVTAVYALRADLTTLDQSFADDPNLTTSKVNVECEIHVSGTLENMDISYDIILPNADEELQNKLNGLLFSDDMKIRQIAYLLAIGSFWPLENNPGGNGLGNIWTSLASSTLSNQLNNLLSGVLSENWTIGTELHSNDSNFSDVEVDVNVSTSLFNDRLTVTGNLGYRNATTATSNFTGDFEALYKINRTGSLVLRIYNVTNDQYYEQALTTQGLGVIYKKEAKRFRQLFKRTRRKTRQE